MPAEFVGQHVVEVTLREIQSEAVLCSFVDGPLELRFQARLLVLTTVENGGAGRLNLVALGC